MGKGRAEFSAIVMMEYDPYIWHKVQLIYICWFMNVKQCGASMI